MRLLKTGIFVLLTTATLSAQWLDYKTPGIPRKSDGKPDLSAAAPKPLFGKPDLSGLWNSEVTGYAINIAGDLKPGELLPWAEAVYKKRLEDLDRDTPATHCLPNGPTELLGAQYRIMQAPNMIAILSGSGTYRQVFTDGRPLPKDPNPTWAGYSIGHWEGDTLVVESAGFNDRTWLDFGGHPHTEALRVTERFQRKDFGHMVYQVTLDDPKTFTRPLTIRLNGKYAADTEMLEYVCNENEQDAKHLVGKASDDIKGKVKVSPVVLAQYSGTYQERESPDKMKAVMSVKDDELIFTFGGKGGLALVTMSESSFFMPGGFPIDFAKDERGAVSHFVLHIAEGDMKFFRVGETEH